MENHKITIEGIIPNSIADELDIKKGDKLVRINGEYIEDALEYKFLISDESIIVEIEKQDGEEWEFDIEKEYDEDLGIIFGDILGKQKSCCNKCIFCFIDQLPKGMRDSLYFKDDDSNLSFMQGNFVTLTNMSDRDIEKIIRYRLSPINISVHSTNMELRKKLLNNKNAGRLIEQMIKLKEGNIEMKAQIVLCPDINDGKQLEKTINDLYTFYPQLSCVAVVPVGLTRYRNDLYPLTEYDKTKSLKVIKQIEKMQRLYFKAIKTRFVFLSDEFYIIAEKELPPFKDYEDFYQLENGVGIVRLFQKEVENSLSVINYNDNSVKSGTIITGEYGMPYLAEAAQKIMDRYKAVELDVVKITNNFFGETIKASGLITGKDIMKQLTNKNISKNILIPKCMLRKNDIVFLDDYTVKDIEKTLNAKVILCKEDGSDLVNNIMEKC